MYTKCFMWIYKHFNMLAGKEYFKILDSLLLKHSIVYVITDKASSKNTHKLDKSH